MTHALVVDPASKTPLIEISNLSVYADDVLLVDRLSLTLHKGQRLTILGETGAGKSILAQAIMGLLPTGLRSEGVIRIEGKSVEEMPLETMAALWGRQLTLLPQEPWHSLDPLMRAAPQVSEVYECVHKMNRVEAQQAAQQDLSAVGLASDGHKLPGQLSGGMAQRLAFSAATAGGAGIILADEPTKGLDARRRDEIALILKRKAADGALLTITHDVELARQLDGNMIVMRQGKVVEQGDTAALLSHPQAEYTRDLMAAAPVYWPENQSSPTASALKAARSLISARGLSKKRGGRELFRNLDIEVQAGEIIGITGDSGSGKSTLGDILLKQLPADAGQVNHSADISRHKFQKLYQDPPSAFAAGMPLHVLFDDVRELHGVSEDKQNFLLDRLRLKSALLQRSVSEVSGGELQRLAIVRALLLDPVLLFADEPVSRLDPITSRDIIFLLRDISRETGCALLLVSHDPVLVDRLCDRTIELNN